MKYKWGELISLEYGKPVKDKAKTDGQCPVYGTNGQIGTSDLPPLCNHASFILGRKGAYRGVHYSSTPFSVIDTAFYAENLHPELLNIEWAYYRFLTYDINSMDSGSAIPSTDRYEIYAIEVDLPDYKSQKKTVELLRSLDNKIELNNKINENLERQAQAIFKAWFIDNSNVAAWRSGTFSELIEKTISGDWGKESPSGNNTEMVYCIRGADIPEVRAGNKGKMPTRYILPKNYAAKQLVDGDIVVEISGGSPTQSTGRVAAISTALLNRYDKGMVCTNFCKALKPIAGYSMYVYHYWQYLYDMSVFFSYENGTTGIKNLDINGFIETEPIHIAPIELVEKFDIFCKSVFSKVYANGLENERLAELRDTLLPQLMSGEIDVSDIQL